MALSLEAQRRRDLEWKSAATADQAQTILRRWALEDEQQRVDASAEAQERRELRDRIARLEQVLLDPQGCSLNRNLVQSMMRGVAKAVRDLIGPRLEVLEEQTKALAQRPVGLSYKGVWLPDMSYAPHSLVSHNGSGWVALEPCLPGERPGAGPSGWRLAIKGAEPSRSARPYELRRGSSRAGLRRGRTSRCSQARAGDGGRSVQRGACRRRDPARRVLT